jgi:dTDP-4-dehydrorhamnose reductase
MKQLVLVLGAGGQLGDAMTTLMGERHEVVGRSRRDLDVTDPEPVAALIGALCPDVVINCSAYTNVDGAESDPVSAMLVNALAVRTLARAAGDVDATLVHYSTDFVFDGETSQPYTEADPPNPRGAYAISKLAGELFAADCPRHYVLRVESLFGGPQARSSVDRMLNAILAGTEVRAFSDRVVSPSFVEDVVEATAALLDRSSPPGLYHCVNTGYGTWVDVARELARLAGRPNAPIAEVPVAAVKLLAPRPQFAALSNAKLADQGINMPTWQDALARYVRARAQTHGGGT